MRLISKNFSIEAMSELLPINEISPSLFLVKPRARRSPPRRESSSGLTWWKISLSLTS
jgi:hypothetical protein